MITTKQVDLRANIKKYFDLAFSGEPVIVSRKKNENVVVISEQEYNDLQKAKRNAEYLARLDQSYAQFEQKKTITLTMDDLIVMEADDWNPTEKIKKFMEDTASNE
ncbi:MAG: type II toxin-antitoxin system Phd/YefM family antitoxin [Lachnospiraceae bacterium]|nr:type II toxin-antitoxin system Phd/YefM family antitoxin [Lachnospiraceae bacterium]